MESSEGESNKKYPLSRDEAEIRKLLLTNTENNSYRVHYNLLLVIRRSVDKSNQDGKADFEGKVDVIFDYYPKDFDKLNISHVKDSPLFLNFVGLIQSVQINNQEISDFKFSNQRLELDLNKLEENKQNKVSILFTGNYNHSGVGLHHYIDPSDQKEYLYTQFEPYDCNRLFPCFDQPDLKAVLELAVVAPQEWIVLSNEFEKENSALQSPDDLDKLHILTDKEKDHLFAQTEVYKKNYHFYYFNATPRISTYLYALCAGPYYCLKSPLDCEVPLRLFFRESMKDYGEPEEMLRVTIAGMKWYKDYFGIAYPFSKYDQIFCPEYNMGAMENVGLVTFNECYWWKDTPTQRKRTNFAITVLHELAHMWFGNLVTMKWWDDLWLNESFATFISHLCMADSKELNQIYTTSWLLFGNYKGLAYRADQQTTTHPVMSDVKNTEVAETHFDEIVYEKGSSILKQMYYFIGDQNFSHGLKNYFETYKWSNTVFDDFINKMIHAINYNLGNEVESSVNLKDLTHHWLKQAGLNEVELDMQIDENENITKFEIKQTPCLAAHPNRQTHMTDIIFINNVENLNSEENLVFRKLKIQNKEITSFNEMIGKKAPKAVILNYNDWAYFKWVIDRRSIDYLKNHLHQISDVLTKQLVYRSIFDLTRDAKLSSLEYFDIISNLIRKETNEDILATVLRNVQGIISNYIPLNYYEKYTSIMFDCIVELLTREVTAYNNNYSKSNKQLILHLVDFAVSFAYTENQIELLKPWLAQEKPSINNVEFDSHFLTQENRFKIVKLIHRSRKISDEEKEKLLQNEVVRDKNSDQSILAKLACYASKPDEKIKEELWKKFVFQSTSDSLYNMETLMANFASRDQLDLVKDYLQNKFFEVVPEVGKANDFFYVRTFVNCLSPSYYVDEETIGKLEKLAEKVKDQDQVHKCILELCDDMKRMLKAHKLCEEYIACKKN
jgi:aminopeptidase N